MCQVRRMRDRSSWENASGRVVLKGKGGFPCEDGEKQYCRFIADKSARLYAIISVCWISLICYVNCLSAAGVHGVHSELSNEKDTVSAGKQSTSSEKFCHYTSHRPNIHWNTEGQDTDIIPRTLFYLQTDHRGELLYAVYLSCCNASSSTWSLGHGTSGSPHSRSSHRRCVVPDQSPKSDNNLNAKKGRLKKNPNHLHL